MKMNHNSYLPWITIVMLMAPLVSAMNSRPIVGVVAQEIREGMNERSYVAASYVKALEAAGARVVPIFINKTLSYYSETLHNINGVVIPGGGSTYGVHGGFSDAVTNVYNVAKQINDNGDGVFPILGVCQGLEMLSFIAANATNPLVPCNSDNVNLPLTFKPKYNQSRLFKYLSPELYNILSTQPVTSNHHLFCLTEDNMKKFNFDQDWRVMSTNLDVNGLKFVSSMEHKRYPFAGVQFHPEKPAYEWNPTQHNPHNFVAIYVNRYFYDWVVNLSKLNNHQFVNKTVEKDRLIYNYPVSYTPEEYDLEIYFFTNKTTVSYH